MSMILDALGVDNILGGVGNIVGPQPVGPRGGRGGRRLRGVEMP